MRADQLVANEAILNRVPVQIVFDHMGVLLPQGLQHPAFAIIRRLIDRGQTWVKLTEPALRVQPNALTMVHDDDVSAAAPLAKAFIAAAPERMLWGSNWPHPGEDAAGIPKPDDAAFFDLLADWAPDERTRHRILVGNPEALYGFSKA
jgi:predicted TIM-barrel fold metal-dependent hydrolase